MMITQELSKHYLYPSTLFASDREFIVDTVLGSCVSVCLIEKNLRIGGINHYMLPFWNGEGLASPKFGNIAIEKLVERMINLGCQQKKIEAKVFGGANQISSINVGERNILVAKEQLASLGIPIVAESVGGQSGRKLRFRTSTGEVMMKMLTKTL